MTCGSNPESGAFGRNQSQFGCARAAVRVHRTTEAPVAGLQFDTPEHRADRLADAVARGVLFDNKFGCNFLLMIQMHVAARNLYGSISLRISSLWRAHEAFEDAWDKKRIENDLIRPLMLHQVRRLFSRRRSAPVSGSVSCSVGSATGMGGRRRPATILFGIVFAGIPRQAVSRREAAQSVRSGVPAQCMHRGGPHGMAFPPPGTSPPPSSPAQAFVLAVYEQPLSMS